MLYVDFYTNKRRKTCTLLRVNLNRFATPVSRQYSIGIVLVRNNVELFCTARVLRINSSRVAAAAAAAAATTTTTALRVLSRMRPENGCGCVGTGTALHALPVPGAGQTLDDRKKDRKKARMNSTVPPWQIDWPAGIHTRRQARVRADRLDVHRGP